VIAAEEATLCVEADAKTSKRMAQEHQRKGMDKMSKGMAQELERFRVIPEEVPHVQRECRAASKSKCKGLLGSIDYRQCKIYEDKTRQTKQDSTGRESLPLLLRMSRMTLRGISRVQDTRMQDTRGLALDGRHKTYGRQDNGRYKTRQNSTPRLGCIECFARARLWKTRQDKTRHTTPRATAEIPASDTANASERHQTKHSRQDGQTRLYRTKRKCRASRT